MTLNLYSQDSTEGDDAVPSYMIAANNHNVGNMNPSMFSEEPEGSLVTRAGKFVAVSAASGLNSFYNTAVWAGNMFSDKEAEYRDTRDWINTFDENLGDYYQENRQAADIVGFVATSFIPGLGGVKVFNAGAKALTALKEGSVAANMARSVGILPGSREGLLKAAVNSYEGTRTAYSLANPATLKAVAAGFGEQALQALAFETAVAVTMKKSPILSDMDASDMIANIATGAALGGAIGGVIEGASTLYKIRQGVRAVDTKLAGVTQDMRGVAGTSVSDSLLIIRNDLDTLAQNAPEGVDPVLYAKLWEDKIGRLDNESRAQFTKLVKGDGNAEVGNLIYEGIRTDSTGSFSAKVLGLEEIGTTHQRAQIAKRYGLDGDANKIVSSNPVPEQYRTAASQLQTSINGKTAEEAAIWFLDGSKPLYSSKAGIDMTQLLGNRASELDNFESVVVGNNQVWFKKGQEASAKQLAGIFDQMDRAAHAGRGMTVEAEKIYHQKVGKLLGYSDKSIEQYVKNRGFVTDAQGSPAQYALRHFKLWGDDMGKLSDDAPAALHLADFTKSGVVVHANRVIAGESTFNVKLGEVWSTADASYKEAMARNIWAMDDTVPRLQIPKNQTYLRIGEGDIPLLTKAYREGFKDFRLVNAKGEELFPPSDLLGYLRKVKDDGATAELAQAFKQGKELPAEHFANKYDTPLGFFTGEQYSLDAENAIFGLAKAQKEYYQKFHANSVNPPPVESVKPWLKQQNYQMVYDLQKVGGLDNFQVEAMTLVRQRQVLQQTDNEAAVAAALRDKASMLPDFTDAELTRVNRTGAGAGFASFANASYGSAGSKAEYVGSLVTNWIREASAKVTDSFMTQNYALVNSPTETAALASVMQKVRAAGSEIYVMDDTGTQLILRKVRDYERAVANGIEDATPPVIPPGLDETIPLGEGAVRNWVKQHIAVNAERVSGFNSLRGAKGQPGSLDAEAFYPPAPNPARFKFHAFAMDDAKVTSTGHTTMLYADSAQALEKQIAEARSQGFSVFTPDQTAQYYKARGMYDYSKGLNESQMDSALKRSGSSAPAFPITGTPQEIIQDIMEWHSKQEAILIREAVSTKYSRQFGTLQQMGAEYASLNQAKMGWKGKFQGEAKNPFEDYVKTFLGASLKQDYPLWTAMNNFVDEIGTKVYNTISGVVGKSKNIYDLEEVNKVFEKYGMKMAATDAQMEAWVNHPAGRAVVSKFIQQQNAVLSTLILRLDPINALNNSVGSPILTGAETASVLRAIRAGNADSVGELAQLAQISLPGTGDALTSPGKLIASAYRNYFGPNSAKLLESYKAKGFVSDTTTQFKQLIEEATISGTETAAELESKSAKMFTLMKKLSDTGEKWTGNKLAEEMNRFVSANIMDQITGIARKAGVMDDKTADAYINTFVNRTQGNMIASQRPQLFQGPVGNAIGLFQTYQFNIMQQLLRYVGEGSRKDALTLLGLQGTIYGMNGLPAFQAINQHIIGTASGNTRHTDAYTSVNNIVGKQAGDWITYGLASNFLIDPDLKINLYSRGDINPRQVTVVPTNMADIPVVSAWAKFATSTKSALGSIAGGGDVWQSILSGIEHHGLNRPLQGIARVARGFDGGVSYSTTGAGSVVSANDFNSLANLARLSGAKPFDEAVTQDAVYRIQAYQAADKKKRDALGVTVKSVVASGGVPSQEQLADFAASYAKAGGKQEEFSKWYVGQIRSATTPQANKIAQNNKSAYSEYMQQIMGGRVLATPPNILEQKAATDE